MTKGEETRLILEGLIKASIAFDNVSFMELLMLSDAIPVDIPAETPAITYLGAEHSDTNEAVANRIETKLKEIIKLKQEFNERKRKEKGASD